MASGGEDFDGEKELVTFCITNDGGDDSSDDHDSGSDSDSSSDSSSDDDILEVLQGSTRRVLLASDNCPDNINVDDTANQNDLAKTRNENCAWMRRTQKQGKNRYKYLCMDQCKDSTRKFTIGTRQKKCDKYLPRSLTEKLLKRRRKKKFADCRSNNGKKVRVYDYCPLACSAVGKGMCT